MCSSDLHKSLAGWLKDRILEHPDFELMAPVNFSLVCFRYKPKLLSAGEDLDHINASLLSELNGSGKLYLSHTRLNGRFVLRMVTAQTYISKDHVLQAWELIKQTALKLSLKNE